MKSRHILLVLPLAVFAAAVSAQHRITPGVELQGPLPAKPQTFCVAFESLAGTSYDVTAFVTQPFEKVVVQAYDGPDCAPRDAKGWGPQASGGILPGTGRPQSLSLARGTDKAEQFELLVRPRPTALLSGETIHGAIVPGDHERSDHVGFDCYAFQAEAGQSVIAEVEAVRVPVIEAGSHSLVRASLHEGNVCNGRLVTGQAESDVVFLNLRQGVARTMRVRLAREGTYSLFISGAFPSRHKVRAELLAADGGARIFTAALVTKLREPKPPEEPAPTLADAKAAIERGDMAKALAMLQRLADYDDALLILGRLHEHGNRVARNEVEARRWYERLAGRGYLSIRPERGEAAWALARMCEEGRGGPVDLAAAARWYAVAAEYYREQPQAAYRLGLILRDGRGVPRDFAKAKKSLENAHGEGLIEASFELGRLLADEGKPADRASAMHILGGAARAGHEGARTRLRAEADRGSVDAQLELGRTHLAGGERKAGLERLRQAMAAGSQDAVLELAASMSSGEATSAQRDEAFTVYGLVQRPDLVPLARVLRANLVRGPSPAAPLSPAPTVSSGLPRHEAAWFARWGLAPTISREDNAAQMQLSRIDQRLPEGVVAARSGDVVAAHLVMLELHRRCVASVPDLRSCAANMHWIEARPSFRVPVLRQTLTDKFTSFYLHELKGIENADAIGKALDAGVNGVQDYVAAEYYYRLAVNEFLRWNHRFDERAAWAHYRLAHIYENGLVGRVDRKRAAKHLEEAAEFGHADAAYAMAHNYLAKGGSDNERSAAHFFRIAGERGIADASFRYAQALEKGKIAETKGPQLLYEHYRRAALAGHLPAISGVARAHWNGWGVPVNKELAQEWWKRAARAGDPEAAWRVAASYSKRGDFDGGMPYLKQAADGGYPGAAEMLASWTSRSRREASGGSGFLAAARFLADVANEFSRQRAQERAIQQAQWAAYSNVGQWSSQGTAGSSSGATSSSTSSSSSSSSSGAQGGSGGSTGSGSSGSSGSDTQGSPTSDGGSFGEGSGRADSGGSGGASGSAGSDRADAEGQASSGRGRNTTGLTIEKAPDRRAEEAAFQRAVQKAEADRQVRLAQVKAKAAADEAASKAALEARRKAAIIACYGSMEAFERAKASCQ